MTAGDATNADGPPCVERSHSHSLPSGQPAAAAGGASTQVAEDLSRMEGEYGAKMLGKLKQMNVLIVGLQGLGIETAKNLVLAGPRWVCVSDSHPAQIADLNTNFYITEQDVQQKKTRGQASMQHLPSLNPNVAVTLHDGQITADVIQQFDVLCVTDPTVPQQTLVEWNAICRSNKDKHVVFIHALTTGVVGHVFSDFGAEWTVFDTDGSPNRSVVLDSISNGAHALVSIDGDRHLLNDGDFVKFEEVRGMSDSMASDEEVTFNYGDAITDINQIHEIRTTKNPKQFTIGDTTRLGQYAGGGIGTQVKRPVVFKYKPIGESMHQPQYNENYMDFSKFGRDRQLHLAQLAIWHFQQAHNKQLPALHSESDVSEVLKYATEINTQHKIVEDDIDQTVIKQVALYYRAELPALTALFGGIVAQEITKHTGKYTPIQQWFHFDALELLADSVPSDAKQLQGTRYDHQIAIFGAAAQQRIEQQQLFLVGCGALGCEYLKAIALTGLGTQTKGGIHITDDDRIELSNLSRQFLFRRHHVGHSKSTSAAGSAIEMNPALKQALNVNEIRVEPKNEDKFNDNFWSQLSFVLNALDNMQARQYVDSKCVWYEKPLFESGTLGTQANSVVCLPHLTPSYSEGAVAGEDQGIAKCTLRNFPSDIVHAIEYAREKFDDLFLSGADNANSYLQDPKSFLEKIKADPLQQADTLKSVRQWLQLASKPSFETCVQIIYDEFIKTYRNAILDLITAFPADARIIERHTGADLGAFWHGHKRFPTAVLSFDPNNELHGDYVYHGASILAKVFGLPERPRHETLMIAAKIQPEAWKYSGGVDLEDEKKEGEAVSSGDILPSTNSDTKMQETEEKAADLVNGKAEQSDDKAEIEALTQELQQLAPAAKQHPLQPEDFEKDVDTNHHVDWITAASNLRGFNYNLKPATRQKVRMTAGKIIPAIATTTATITGFILIEIYKRILDKPLEAFRAATINLGTNTYVCENLPDPIKKKSGMDQATYMQVKAIPEGFTVWDHVTIEAPNATLEEFLAKFQEQHHGCEIDMLSSGSSVLYNAMDLYTPERKEQMNRRLKQSLVQVYEDIVGPVFPADRTYLHLDATVETEDGDTGIVPTIKYVFR